jgi:hypothetical protein
LPLVRVNAIPADANPSGDIFGGRLLAQTKDPDQALATVKTWLSTAAAPNMGEHLLGRYSLGHTGNMR